MQNHDNLVVDNNFIKKTSVYSNTFFLMCHLGYLLFFLLTKSYILVFVNCGSIMVYSLLYIIIKKKMYALYASIAGTEITAFMVTGTILTGFQTGFHLCLIGLCILAFYSGYFSMKTDKKIKPLYWGIVFLTIYVALYFICLFVEPYYELSLTVKSIFYLIHTFIVFTIVIIFLYVFIKYVNKLENKIMNESRTDKLTQIPNRMALLEYIDLLGDEKDHYILSIFDIDDFKVINDRYGHICGDYILKEMAKLVTSSNGIDFVARFGGEEFIIIARLNKEFDEVVNDIDNIRKSIDEYNFEFNNIKIHSTVTIGVSKYEYGISVNDWIEMADKKLYDGKKSGKNKTVA